MAALDGALPPLLTKYLSDIEQNWQPTDFLPDPGTEDFAESLKDLQGWAMEMSYIFWVVLIGDTVTEEALPTYESWIMSAEGMDQIGQNNWSKWMRGWTCEENRHGDLLNKYLYLCGAVNMREMEITTQHLINDGFQTGMGHDPYKNFIYTSFQELATNVSHRRTATLAKKAGNGLLAKICGVIAADEMRHANAYSAFMKLIFEMDPNGAIIAFNDMMKMGITMPAHFMRESGGAPQGEAFIHFAECAQALGVYTSHDYVDIYNSLINDWNLGSLTGLSSDADKAREELLKRPQLINRIANRMRKPRQPRRFKWVSEKLPYL
jgi:acyl-[acyl-carrier-protein] desaturase